VPPSLILLSWIESPPTATLVLIALAMGLAVSLAVIAGLVALRTVEKARTRSERQFNDTMIESMPGIVYFYDHEGRFLRWNKNFERVSGYSASEIATMRPLDFFSESEKSLLSDRIKDVFETGESSVEASFVSKDGHHTPYYFTGRKFAFEGKTCLVGVGVDISRRKIAETKLAESEREYRELVQLANSIILRWDRDGVITLMNDFGLQFFGYTRREIIGRHVVGTIVPEMETTGRDLQNLMERILENPKGFEQNVNENLLRSGERVWVSWTNRIVRDSRGNVVEILSIGTDITEKRRMEQALSASERKFSTLFRASPVAVALSSLDGVMLDVNDAFLKLFGVERDRVVGHKALDVPGLYESPQHRAILLETFQREGRVQNFEMTRPRPDGSILATSAAIEPMEIDGQPLILSAVVDVTPQKRAQEQLQELNATLEARVEARTQELAVANKELEAFCYSVSHDLRAPLRTIDGFSKAIEEDYTGQLDPVGIDYLHRVRNAANRMGDLIDDLLDLSRVSRAEMRVERVDLSSLAHDVVSDLRQQDPDRAVDVEIQSDISIDGDKNLLRILLVNLISNSWKYTSKTALPRIEFGCRHVDGVPTYFVRDNGAGFDAAYSHKLFQPFQRLHHSDEFPGHGIGLATVLRIARRHGGMVSASGSVGNGAEFRFTTQIPNGRAP
jgi:PAS domain S-box-containing protein